VSDTADAVIEVRELGKTYGSTTAVADVSFDVQRGEVFALVGPNGAGKTTIVEILECLRTPTGGTARVCGHEVASEPRAIKGAIGVLPQSFRTFDRLTVRENVALARRMYDSGQAVDATLDRLDLADWADTRFASLSGGLQRRTGIAMATVSDPEVLFLDEPTTGLDPAARRTTWGVVEALVDAGTTVVLTTHYMEEVEVLADRAALLVDGRLEAVDTVDALVDAYGGAVRLVVRDPDDAVEARLRELASEVNRSGEGELVGTFEAVDAAQDAFGTLVDMAGERSLELSRAGMEDVFLELAGGTVDSRGELQ
jgi:ABC-2 type transport system ATP-binding protein